VLQAEAAAEAEAAAAAQRRLGLSSRSSLRSLSAAEQLLPVSPLSRSASRAAPPQLASPGFWQQAQEAQAAQAQAAQAQAAAPPLQSPGQLRSAGSVLRSLSSLRRSPALPAAGSSSSSGGPWGVSAHVQLSASDSPARGCSSSSSRGWPAAAGLSAGLSSSASSTELGLAALGISLPEPGQRSPLVSTLRASPLQQQLLAASLQGLLAASGSGQRSGSPGLEVHAPSPKRSVFELLEALS
jgi:hypothetical protein